MSILADIIALWFGSGRLPKAPGTWGSLAALPPAALLTWLGGVEALLIATLLLIAIGYWASADYVRRHGRDDPPEVVVDEVAGQWIALLPVAGHPLYWPLAFIAFRLFDILKPWPVGWADRRLPGAFGIMADDVVAGLYAALLCLVLLHWIPVR